MIKYRSFFRKTNKRTNDQDKSCFLGHSKCYHKSKECVYELDGNGQLTTCRNGAHLADCVHIKSKSPFCMKFRK